MGHCLGSKLWNEYPAGDDASAKETVYVFAWRLINPPPDSALTFQCVFDVAFTWLETKCGFNLIIGEVACECCSAVIVVFVLIAHVLALCLRQKAFMSLNIVRVCAMCQQETKTVLPTVPNVAYSHGACRRHALITFEKLLGKEKALEFVASKPDSYFCPEIKL